MRVFLFTTLLIVIFAQSAHACSCFAENEIKALLSARNIPVVAKVYIGEESEKYYTATSSEVIKGFLPKTFWLQTRSKEQQKGGIQISTTCDFSSFKVGAEYTIGLKYNYEENVYRPMGSCSMHMYHVAMKSEYADLVDDPAIIFWPKFYLLQNPQLARPFYLALTALISVSVAVFVLRRKFMRK